MFVIRKVLQWTCIDALLQLSTRVQMKIQILSGCILHLQIFWCYHSWLDHTWCCLWSTSWLSCSCLQHWSAWNNDVIRHVTVFGGLCHHWQKWVQLNGLIHVMEELIYFILTWQLAYWHGHSLIDMAFSCQHVNMQSLSAKHVLTWIRSLTQRRTLHSQHFQSLFHNTRHPCAWTFSG